MNAAKKTNRRYKTYSKNPSLMNLMRSGAKVIFPSGFSMTGYVKDPSPQNHYIELRTNELFLAHVSMSREGVAQAYKSKLLWDKSQRKS